MEPKTPMARKFLPPPVRTALRWVAMLTVFLATADGVYRLATVVMDFYEVPFSITFPPMYLGMAIEDQVAALPARTPDATTRIGYLGDSTVQGYPEGFDVATQFDQALERAAPGEFEVFSFAHPGTGPLEYYALGHTLLGANADAIVISFNTSSLSPQARDFWARRPVSGWIPPSQIPDALGKPLGWWNITFDRLLFYIAMVRAGLRYEWLTYRGMQLRAGFGVEKLRRRIQGIEADWASSLPDLPSTTHPDHPMRYTKSATVRLVGDAGRGAPVDHPVFEMLGAAIDNFRAHEVDVWVYATPTNFEHMERVGIDTRAGLKTTIVNLERVVKDHGGRFLDLHRTYPDAAFRDGGNHLTYEGEFLGPQELGARIADWYLEGHRDGAVRGGD